MFIQPRRQVEVLRWSTGGLDAHNNPIVGYAEPEPLMVYGWEVPRTAEPLRAGHDRVIVDLSMFVPPGTEISAHDRVVINDREFEVVGEVEDAGNGPFGFDPGATVQLRRIEG